MEKISRSPVVSWVGDAQGWLHEGRAEGYASPGPQQHLLPDGRAGRGKAWARVAGSAMAATSIPPCGCPHCTRLDWSQGRELPL